MERNERRPRARKILAIAALAAAATTTAAYLGISLLTADLLTRPNNHPHRRDPYAVGGDAIRWSTRTADQLTLRGWFYPRSGLRRLVVLVHGMGGSWDEMAGLGRDLHTRG